MRRMRVTDIVVAREPQVARRYCDNYGLPLTSTLLCRTAAVLLGIRDRVVVHWVEDLEAIGNLEAIRRGVAQLEREGLVERHVHIEKIRGVK